MKPSTSTPASSNGKGPTLGDAKKFKAQIDAMDWADADSEDVISGNVASQGEASRRGSTASTGTEPVNRKASMNNSK